MIATVTLNPAVDYTVTVDDPLTAGDVGRATEHRYDPGGKGINVSKFLAARDVETVATGPVGGFVGDYLADALARNAVPADLVEIDGRTRMNATVHAPDGEFKVNQAGPEIGESDVEAVLEVLASYEPDRVVVAGSLPPGLDVGTVDRIAAAGAWETVVDLGGDALASLEGSYTLCKPNREELAAATDRSVETVDDAVEAARSLREHGFDRVLASLGADGAVLVGGDEPVVREAPDAEVVDTVGAGDALLSGYLAAEFRGASPAEALDEALEVAAAVLGVRGPSVPESF